MKVLDRWGQRIRINKALRYITPNSTILDIGCLDGALFRRLGDGYSAGVGIDPDAAPLETSRFRIIRGRFPEDLGGAGTFDAITALAVLEHVPRDEQPAFAAACYARLHPHGRVVITVPAPAVDRIVDILTLTPWADGVACHEHYGFEPHETLELFQRVGFWVHAVGTFELGLNHLFVFTRPG